MENISFEDWSKLNIKTGKILSVEEIEGADKLYKLQVDTGDEELRVLVAGLKEYYSKEELEGKNCLVLCNLEPKTMKGIESQGMILAAVSEDHSEVVLLQSEKDISPGTKVS